jgi:peptide/nickel transport system ATP-binding protein
LNLLKELQKELSLSFMIISHDLSVIRMMSERVAVMYLGRVVEEAETDDLFERPNHPYTQALINSIPRLTSDRRSAPLVGDLPDPRHPPAGCRFHSRCPVGPLFRPERTSCVSHDPQTNALGMMHRAACHFADSSRTPIGVAHER